MPRFVTEYERTSPARASHAQGSLPRHACARVRDSLVRQGKGNCWSMAHGERSEKEEGEGRGRNHDKALSLAGTIRSAAMRSQYPGTRRRVPPRPAACLTLARYSILEPGPRPGGPEARRHTEAARPRSSRTDGVSGTLVPSLHEPTCRLSCPHRALCCDSPQLVVRPTQPRARPIARPRARPRVKAPSP